MHFNKRVIAGLVWLIGCVMAFAYVKDGRWQVLRAAYPPIIDGEMDDIYKTASTERVVRIDQDDPAPPDGYLDLFATARLMWDSDYLYVFVKVVDDEISSTSDNSWENDSVEFLIDGDNSKADALDFVDDVQMRIEYQDGSDNTLYDSVLGGKTTYNIEGVVADWENPNGDAFGYAVEAAFPLAGLNIDAEEGTVFGFEIQINDRDNETRENMFRWFGNSNDAWHDPSLWGETELVWDWADDILNINQTWERPVIDGVLDSTWYSWIDIAPSIYGSMIFNSDEIVGEFTDIQFWEDAQMEFRIMYSGC